MDRYVQSLQVELQPDRETWRVLAPFVSGTRAWLIQVPQGVETDFASVPRWPLTFALLGSYGHAAAVIHDRLYTTNELSLADANRVFHEALRSSGIARWRAWLIVGRIGGAGRDMR